jgi:hypothetical protein
MRLLPCLPLLLLATACVPLGTPITNADLPASQQRTSAPAANTVLRYQDYIYDPSVRSVQCYVASATANVTS